MGVRDVFANGRKETWRGWVYNEFLRRWVPRRPADAVVYYMPGPVDRDREAMVRKGFRSCNLIAVDRDRACVDTVRNRGGVAVCGEFDGVIANLSARDAAAFVFADYLGGFGLDVGDLIQSLFVSQGVRQGTVVAVNMLRGREKKDCSLFVREAQKELGTKHRGVMFFEGVMQRLHHMWDRNYHRPFTMIDKAMLHQMMNPKIYSYRSASKKFYDTVVFTWPFDEPLAVRNKEPHGDWDKVVKLLPAMRAIRTKRGANA